MQDPSCRVNGCQPRQIQLRRATKLLCLLEVCEAEGDAGAVKRQLRLAGGLHARDDVPPLKPLSASSPRGGGQASFEQVCGDRCVAAGRCGPGGPP